MIQSWIFSIVTPIFSVTGSFRNHSNMLIWLRNIYYSFPCWKHFLHYFCKFVIKFKKKESVLIFSNDALNWSKLTVDIYYVPKKSISNACYSFNFLSKLQSNEWIAWWSHAVSKTHNSAHWGHLLVKIM